MEVPREITATPPVWRGWNAKGPTPQRGEHQKGPKTKCTHRRPSHFPLKEHLDSELPSFTLQRVCGCLKSLKVWEELLGTKDWIPWTSHWRRQSQRLSTNPEQWLSQTYTWNFFGNQTKCRISEEPLNFSANGQSLWSSEVTAKLSSRYWNSVLILQQLGMGFWPSHFSPSLELLITKIRRLSGW